MSKKRRLGKGLSALIGDTEIDSVAFAIDEAVQSNVSRQASITVADIVPNRHQPRRQFDSQSIRQLADSIKSQGLIQPIVVNDRGDGSYELISGERRLRAVKTLRWKTVSAVIREVDEAGLLEMTLVENLQREDLNPIEEAHGYRQLAESFGLTQAGIAKRVGRERSTVANSLRLLKLPEVICHELSSGVLSAGHARQLLAIDSESEQIELARRVIENDISVRQLEKLIRQWKKRKDDAKVSVDSKDNSGEQEAILELEDRLRRALNTKVRISNRSDGRGKIEIEYYSYDEFERLLDIFNVPPLA